MASRVSCELMRAVWREGLVRCWFAVAKPQKPLFPRGGSWGLQGIMLSEKECSNLFLSPGKTKGLL